MRNRPLWTERFARHERGKAGKLLKTRLLSIKQTQDEPMSGPNEAISYGDEPTPPVGKVALPGHSAGFLDIAGERA